MQLVNVAYLAKEYFQSLFEREEGQDVFEYLLIIAGISVAIIAAGAIAAPGLFEAVAEGVCTLIEDPADGLGMELGDCAALIA